MDLIGLIPSFGGLLWTLVAFVVALSVIVAVHEYGHYIVGRWSGIKAEVFSIGFGPVLWSRKDKHGTVWQVAALPLGGYVKFLGDASAASDKADEAVMARLGTEERRHTMHGAPLWARAATVAAGPVFNFILSIIVFTGIVMVQGMARDPLTVAEVAVLPGDSQGLQAGDVILGVEGQEAPGVEGFGDFIATLPVQPVFDWTVLRDGAEVTVSAPYPYPPLVGGVSPQSAALEAGLQEGDVITAVNGDPVWTFDQLRAAVDGSGGGELALTVWRGGETLPITLTPRRMDLPLQEGGFETRWLIGVNGGLFFTPETEMPGIVEAVSYGADQVMFVIRSSLSGLYHMAVGAISTCNLQGPIGIAETSGAAASQGWMSFIWFIAVLSTAVGLLNLFPIPILDGGHLVFHAYEALAGRPPSDRVLRVMMGMGIGLMGLLMVFALTNDIFCP
jgi:regulator of sigma E protease